MKLPIENLEVFNDQDYMIYFGDSSQPNPELIADALWEAECLIEQTDHKIIELNQSTDSYVPSEFEKRMASYQLKKKFYHEVQKVANYLESIVTT